MAHPTKTDYPPSAVTPPPENVSLPLPPPPMRVYQTTIATVLAKMPVDQAHMTIKGTILEHRGLYKFLSPGRGPVLWLDSPDVAKLKKAADLYGIELVDVEMNGLEAFAPTFTCSKRHPVTSNHERGSSAQSEGGLSRETTYHCWVCNADFPESALNRLR